MIDYAQNGAHPIDETGGSATAEEIVDVHGEVKGQLDCAGESDPHQAVEIASDDEVDSVILVEELVAATDGCIKRVFCVVGKQGDRLDHCSGN